MSFDDCIAAARAEIRQWANPGSSAKGTAVTKDMADEAENYWRKKREEYIAAGDRWHIAEAKAEMDAKDFIMQMAAKNRHAALMTLATTSRMKAATKAASNDAITNYATRFMTVLDMKARALKRRFDSKMTEYLQENYRDILGRNTDQATLMDIVRERHGESTGNLQAKAIAEAIGYAYEDMRLQFNEAGGMIGKLDNWGIPHSHNRTQIMNAGIRRLAQERGVSTAKIKLEMAKPTRKGESIRNEVFARSFPQWFDDIHDRIDWTHMTDYDTGRPFQGAGESPPPLDVQEAFLRTIFDRIIYGDRATNPSYGQGGGGALYKEMSKQRVLHFKSADDWIAYNKEYGSGDPHKSIIAHAHRMAKDIVAMQEFGPNPELGLEFQGQLIVQQAKERGLSPQTMEKNIEHSRRMMRIERGGRKPEGYSGTMSANFFSNVRTVLSGNLLERASIASLSDNAFIRGVARSIGANPNNALSNQVRIISELAKSKQLSTEEMLQWGWIADTHADPGVAAARFEAEMPSAEWAERFSTGVMRLSGLTSMTDGGRFNLYQTWSGRLATQMGRKFNDIDPEVLTRLKEVGITASDWDHFSRADLAFEAGNGAKFLNALYWREATDLPAKQADDIYLKFGAAAETVIEEGVPTQSLYMRAIIDPAGRDLAPGSLIYELMKSGGMFKSFVMAVTTNQFNVMRRMPTGKARGAHAMKVVFEATISAAVAMQIIEIAKGNDPMPMDNVDFWGKAVMKGGGLAILGDIIVAGETKWGGGVPSYLAGPMVQLGADTWRLSGSNLIEVGRAVLAGEEIDTGFAKELRRYTGRYLIPKDLVYLGPTVDRLLLDQAQMFFDPDSITAIERASTLRQNRDRNASWWMPGSPMPSRAPRLDPSVFFQP